MASRRPTARGRLKIPRACSSWVGYDLLALLAKPLDGELHHVAGLEEQRRRLDAEAHARRRAGGDDVARQKRHVLADVRDDLRDAEHHGARVAGLHALAVDLERHAERLRVADLVGGDEPGADRARGVEALALVPLRGRHLEGALRDIVDDAVARDVAERGGLVDVSGLAA